MDVRGCGKSGGEFRLMDRNEQRDLYDVIEWLGHQPWSSGKVGGIGQSYFCMSQWWMAIQQPPSLACISAFDGLNDPYRAPVYQGGILGDFFGAYWWNQNRIINRNPANGEFPREQPCDLNLQMQEHPTYDDFWRERDRGRAAGSDRGAALFGRVWGKVDLHTRGNIDGYRRAPAKKLRVIGPLNAFVANREFNSPELHEKMLLPFYDIFSKASRPNCAVGPRSNASCAAPTVSHRRGLAAGRRALCYLASRGAKSGSVTSLNDGNLTRETAAGEAKTS